LLVPAALIVHVPSVQVTALVLLLLLLLLAVVVPVVTLVAALLVPAATLRGVDVTASIIFTPQHSTPQKSPVKAQTESLCCQLVLLPSTMLHMMTGIANMPPMSA
jgi:hypothetical protein